MCVLSIKVPVQKSQGTYRMHLIPVSFLFSKPSDSILNVAFLYNGYIVLLFLSESPILLQICRQLDVIDEH